MKLADFDFELPNEKIARFPSDERDQSRLMIYDGMTDRTTHQRFDSILAQLKAGDALVINDTKVIKARLSGRKASGGAIELLVERINEPKRALAHVKSNRSPKVGAILEVADGKFQVVGRVGRLFDLSWLGEQAIVEVLEAHGQIPLPPYMDRAAQSSDNDRYQTVYARKPGSVAAPTAGLHFTESLLEAIAQKGIKIIKVTLQVGAGTFLPVTADDITEHDIHSEYVEVTEAACEQITQVKAKGGRVIAVGTTAVRSIETASQSGQIKPFYGESKLFIYPGYVFKTVDAIVTNFHLPKSSLLMLVAAFIGLEAMHQLYQLAIQLDYRFYSYGDAMLLWPPATKKT